MTLEQKLVEHLHKCLAIGTFGHLKQVFANYQLSNFLVPLEVCHLCHKFLIQKSNLRAKLCLRLWRYQEKYPSYQWVGDNRSFGKFNV